MNLIPLHASRTRSNHSPPPEKTFMITHNTHQDADNKPVKSILRTTLQRIKIRKRETLRRMPRGGGGEKKKVSFSLTPEQEEREVEKKRSFKERERAEMALLIQYVLEIERRKRAAAASGGVVPEGDSDGESASEEDVMKLQAEIEALEKYQKEEIAVQANEAELLRIEEEIKRLEAEVASGVGGGEVVQAIAEGEGYTPTATPPISSEEDEEIRRIQEEIKRLEDEEAASAASAAASCGEQSGGEGSESASAGETAELEEDLFRQIELQIMAMSLVRAAEEKEVASLVVEERKVEGVALMGGAESKEAGADTPSKEVQEGNEGEGEEDDEDIKQIREEIKSLEAEMESYKAEAEEVEAGNVILPCAPISN